jgi:hypothetical protein
MPPILAYHVRQYWTGLLHVESRRLLGEVQERLPMGQGLLERTSPNL